MTAVLALTAVVSGCSHGGSNSSAGNLTTGISIEPRRAALTIGQQISLTATTNDSAGVRWSVTPSSGSLDAQTSRDGQTIHFTAPNTAGVFTVKATGITDSTQSSSVVIGVTDLAGVYTYHNNLGRTGFNDREYALTTSNVNTDSFGKLFSCFVDGAIYTQPLWVANLKIGGRSHNVIFVGTTHDSLYAFDADSAPCSELWRVNLIDTAHGETGGEKPVPGNVVGKGDGDLVPEIGITGTPVIDPTKGILYVVSKSMSSAGTIFYQRLHAIDLATGAERAGSPITITATFPGTGDHGSQVAFNARQEHQRAALALVNGVVYIAWGSHEDRSPFFGWIMGYTYNGATFSQAYVLNTGPNTHEAGIWMSGAAPAADANNDLYVITGNGGFDALRTSPPNTDYGNSLLKLSSNLQILQYFTPSAQEYNNATNNDFGAGGAAVLTDLPEGSPLTHIAIAGGKDGNLFVVNRDALGGFGDGKAWQQLSIGAEGDMNENTPGVIFSVPVLWNNYLYIAGARGPLKAFRLDPATAKLSLASTATVPAKGFGYPGSTPALSSQGTANGIVWILDNGQYCTPASPGCGPSVLHAYDATNVGTELWNSSKVSADTAGHAVKFTVPTIANGKVYVGTRGDNKGGGYRPMTNSGELDVYGLKPH
ncbi:MAG TPA: hypothetical protein VI653_28250 [Steroidobacteraceae bacterium]